MISGRPSMPPPGAPSQEHLIARFRGQIRRLFLSALVLIAVAGLTGYFTDNLPEPFTNVMLWAAAGAIVLLLVIVPFLVWLSRRYTITTRRVITTTGLLMRHRRELTHARGYTMTLTRGPLQRLWGAGNISLSNGAEPAMLLRNVPNVRLIHEVLVDQVEINQILAHRDAQALPYTV